MTHRATKESPINTTNWTVDDAVPHKYYYIIGMHYPVSVEFGNVLKIKWEDLDNSPKDCVRC